MKAFLPFLALAGLACAAGLQLKDLPPAVQKTVQAQLKGGQIRHISKETEDGVTQYEIETMLNGKHRDFNVDTAGKLLDVEEQASLEALPAPARAAVEKQMTGGELKTVETLTRNGRTDYEVSYKKGGKTHEVTVSADGSIVK